MASRGSPGVLESVSSISLNTLHDANPPLKKRKTRHTGAGDLATSSIVIRAPATSSSSLSDERLILDPITVIPRSRVPFSWLDTSFSTPSPIQSGSLFVADIPDLENDLQERVEPTVLAVRLVSSDEALGLYIIERVKAGIYALSRLGPWVEEGDIFVALKGWTASASSAIVPDEQKVRAGSPSAVDWWRAARVEDPVVGEVGGGGLSGKRAKVDVCVAFFDHEDARGSDVSPMEPVESQASLAVAPHLQAIERSSSTDVHMPNAPAHDTQEQNESMVFGDVGDGDELNNQVNDLQSPQELLDGLREQYLQALYISKTSLAYFAKGPLTRCRAAFQFTESASSKKPIDLVNFYREAILPAKKMDLKYRETLPSTVRDVMLSVSDDEPTQTKKRKSRKKKLGRNGLYPEEADFIRRWWKDRSLSENGVTIETSREAEMKKHVADLRLRETQLQILLILETMALESSVSGDTKPDDVNGEKTPDEAPKKSKSKKLQDLNVVLELHLDRLCIWHAVSFDDLAIPDTVKDTENNHLSGKKAESDAVRDFCTEVIVPFYASRLPDKCKLITRKFGVSSSATSTKQPHAKKAPRRESESATKRQQQQQQQQQQPQRPRRTLQRVLTDEQFASQGRHPSLHRSKTAPSNPDAKKRESMEPLLPMASANVRGGIQKAKRVENREVDLDAAALQHETKLKKVQMMVDQKKELDAAIHTLRRPNRELVAKDMAEDANKRASTSGGGGGGSARKQKNPVRNPLGQGVQVMATPKGSRKKDATALDLPPPPLPTRMMRRFARNPNRSPSPDEVPASAVRPSSFSWVSNMNHRGDSGAIQETPTRRPPKSFEKSARRSPPPSYPSGNLFRVPSRPSMQSTTTDIAPSTPVSRRPAPRPNNPIEQMPQPNSSMITETPPRKQPSEISTTTTSIPSMTNHDNATSAVPPSSLPQPESPRATILDTPVEGDFVQVTPVKNNASAVTAKPSAVQKTSAAASTVPVTPEKSIYEQLGWNDDDELAL